MIFIILFLGLLLRLWNLNQSYWLDEAINVLAVRDNSLINLITQYALGDFHPPLYHIFLWFWTRGFGFSEIAIRMLSVIFGLATVYLCYLLLKRFFTPTTGLLTSLFLTTSPLHIYYSQESRMYAETAFFALLSIYFYVRIFTDQSKSNWKIWIGYVVSTLFLLYSEYMPIFLILAQNIIVLLYMKKSGKNFLLKWFCFQVLLLILFLPWIPFLWQQFHIATAVGKSFPVWNQVVGQMSIKNLLLIYIKFIIGRISIVNKYIYTMVLVPVILFVAGLGLQFWIKKKNEKSSQTFLLLFLLPIFLAFVVSVYLSIFSYFRFLYLLPIFYLLLAIGIKTLSKKSIQIAAIIILLSINFVSVIIFNTNKRFWREDWRSAVSFIESGDYLNSVAVMVNPAQNAGYKYYSRGRVPLVYADDWNYNMIDTVWLIRYVQPIFDTTDSVRQNIEKAGLKKLEEYDFNGVVVWKYIL